MTELSEVYIGIEGKEKSVATKTFHCSCAQTYFLLLFCSGEQFKYNSEIQYVCMALSQFDVRLNPFSRMFNVILLAQN